MISLSIKPQMVVPLADLHVAAENIRHDDAPDDEIDALGASLLNGQVAPLFVRRSRDGETGVWQVLDGRRRLLAWKRLIKRKEISPKHQVAVIEAESAEEIAAAVVVSNSARLAVTEADVLLAIHRLSREFKTPDEIGKILGLDAKEVRRRQKLGAVDERLLLAFKKGKIDLRTLKAVARLDPAVITPAMADDWAKRAKIGQLSDYSIRVDGANSLTVKHNRLRFVDLTEYAARGGRIEQDLFDEEPDRLLDPQIVDELFFEAVEPVDKFLRDAGLKVAIDADLDEVPEADLSDDQTVIARIPWGFKGDTADATIEEAKREVNTLAREAARAAGDRGKFLAAVEMHAKQSLRLAQLRASPLKIVACEATEDALALNYDFYVRHADLEAHMGADAPPRPAPTPPPAISATNNGADAGTAKTPDSDIEVDEEGFAVLQHQFVTTTAGRALARSLSDNPSAAMNILVASLFRQVVLDGLGALHQSRLLKISASVGVDDLRKPDAVFQQPILDRLADFRKRYTEAAVHPFVWVQGLDGDDFDDLLAQLVALQVSTFEQDQKSIRYRPRAEAAHVAAAIGHDIRRWFRPDAEFYAGLNKRKLLELAGDMGVDQAPLAKLKRPELAAKIFELAAEHDYVPPAFSFALAAAAAPAAAGAGTDQVAA